MNKRILLTALWIGVLLVGLVSPAQAQAAISGLNPMEGTVGTQVTITGSGFGEKHGEVLLGEEKCKLLEWSDTQITFMVDKPQPPGGYPVTVLLQGDKKPTEPLTFEAFAMRRPRINPGELLHDGATATIVGAFFGDKKGALRLAYLEGGAGGEGVIEDPKILDWSMNTIRFELPDGLIGKFILGVGNEVGAGLALLDLGGGTPLLGDYVPPYPAGYGHEENGTNSSGVFFRGSFYVFSTTPHGFFSWEHPSLRFRKLTNGKLSDFLPITKGETETTPVPLVVGDKLWLFHTATDSRILYTVFDGITWDNQWHDILGLKTDGSQYEIAAVYNPDNNRITVFVKASSILWVVYSIDNGKNWFVAPPQIPLSEAPSAVYYKGSINGIPYDTLVAVNQSGTQRVYALRDGMALTVVYSLDQADTEGRPFLVDDQGSDYIYLVVYWNDDPLSNVLKNELYISRMHKNDGSWDTFTKTWDLPPGVRDGQIGFYYFSSYWSPNGAINYEWNSTTGLYDRKFYINYGWAFNSWDFQTVTNAKWTMSLLETPGTGVPSSPPPPPVLTQVSGGEWHTCGLRSDGVIDCWGDDDGKGRTYKPDGTFQAVSSASWHNCGIKTDGTLYCWGEEDRGRISGRPTGNTFTQVTVGDWHGCGLKTNGSVDCWGIQDGGRTDDKAGPFKQVRSGNWHNCAIKTDDTLYCWGINDTGRTVPPAGTFKQIDVADWHGCGVRTNGTVDCWGKPDAGRTDDPPSSMTFKQVTTGNWHNCGIKTDGTLYCWGSSDDGRVSDMPTTGTYTYIDAGDRHTCAIRSDGHVICWGTNSSGQCNAPYSY
jgi:hypothetical protein